MGASDAPTMGASQGVSDTPMLFFDNLVKKIDKLSP